MGRLHEGVRKSLNSLIEGLASRDIDLMVKVCLELATPQKPLDKRLLYDDIEHMVDSHLSSDMRNINMSEFITSFIRMFKHHNLTIPSELTILAKSLSILEGVFQELAPNMNLITTAKDYLS